VLVKQLVFRAPLCDREVLEAKRAGIRNLIAGVKKTEQAMKNNETTKQGDQEKLVRRPGGPVARLKEVFVKPAISKGKGSQRLIGDIEAHENGLRFSSKTVGTPLDIMYSNIKHVIVVPSRKEPVAAIHVALRSEILLQNLKRTAHVHFWVQTETEGDDIVGHTNKTEEEEDAEAERAAAIKEKINKEFITFSRQLRQVCPIPVEVPFREAWFEGNIDTAGSGSLSIACTSSAICAVLDTTKFFVLGIEEVECVIFERVKDTGRGSVDMTFIPKNYTQPVQQIHNVRKSFVAMLKDLCCEKYKLRFYETPQNNNWREIMKVVVKAQTDGHWVPWAKAKDGKEDEEEEEEESDDDDDDSDDEQQGWEQMFNAEDSSSDSSAEGSGSDDEEEEESEEDDDSEDTSLASDEDESVEESEDEDEDDWSDMQAEAEDDDRKRKWADDDDEKPAKRARKPAKPAAKAKPSKSAPKRR